MFSLFNVNVIICLIEIPLCFHMAQFIFLTSQFKGQALTLQNFENMHEYYQFLQ